MVSDMSVYFVTNRNDGRGTISLLLQCLTTIFLRVYTTFYSDSPAPPLNKGAIFVRRTIFGTIIVMASELIPFNTFSDKCRA